MGNHDPRTAVQQFLQCGFHFQLRSRVQTRCGLVQNDDGRSSQEQADQRQPLGFPGRQGQA